MQLNESGITQAIATATSKYGSTTENVTNTIKGNLNTGNGGGGGGGGISGRRPGDIEDGLNDNLNNFMFNEKSIRKNFQRKIYSLLMIQLLITSSIISLFVLNKDIKLYVLQHTEFIWISLIIILITLITLICSETIRRQHPINLIFLGVFTIAESFLLGVISANFDTTIVLLVMLVTGLVCLALSLYALQTKYDFTTIGGLLIVCLFVLIIFGLITIIIPSKIMMCIYSAMGVLLFSFYLIFDVQLIADGKHRYSIEREEYIFAVLALYLDIINLYMYILSLIGLLRN